MTYRPPIPHDFRAVRCHSGWKLQCLGCGLVMAWDLSYRQAMVQQGLWRRTVKAYERMRGEG